ncbi:hypothetical protein RND71_000820 [Anisodus tanguticus]|uniref:Lipoxygenase n=1 Tax=Anisodus tanguticus TaxID=243964 RepID=A0AAE1SWP7_9SOLA|nr:hypothetical protein RND71_000820 [Anisodus tanguticus]
MSRKLSDPSMDENASKKARYEAGETKTIKGTVVLMKKNFLDLTDAKDAVVDQMDEILGHKVSLQLISSVNTDLANKGRGKLGKPAYLEGWKISTLTERDATFSVNFEWNEEIGVPGAFLIKNSHHNEFYLKTLTLDDVPGHGKVYFVCNSWIYHSEYYKKDRVFFANQSYLPNETPAPLQYYREEELENLRGNGTGKREEWDRVYDYDVYNDLGDPEKGETHVRKILGGSSDYPYPRRGRTGRPPTKIDPKCESRMPLRKTLDIFVPRDERFSPLKMSDFAATGLKSIFQFIVPGFLALFHKTPLEFDSFKDMLKLYEGGIKLPSKSFVDKIGDHLPLELLKELVRSDGDYAFKFPMPQVIREDKSAWATDEEFAREMLAGLNPVVVHCLQEFPPTSKLDPKLFGEQRSTISEEHVKDNLDGLPIDQAIKDKRLFILDHHDSLMPYLKRINTTTTQTYASRTLLFLKEDGSLKPLAIELTREDEQSRIVSKVYTPAESGVEATIWQLAKAYVTVDDSGYHQLISHWLHTHAVIEPFIIATNRQLSVLHPIYKLLHPHFRDTMYINALARQLLINADGILEMTVFPGKFSLEMSATIYKDWVFPQQALPADLIKRGMAVEDSSQPHGIKLVIEDYPYAVDGLEIWSAIKTWVRDYCNFYYKTDEMVQKDTELQSWWKEVREKGHGDKKDEPWWPKLQTREELIECCTIIIWIASALHAAINFGQYPYGGYPPNRPSMSRRFMPEPETFDYEELKSDPEKAFLKTITPLPQSILGIALIEALSLHTSDEVFLGKRAPEWTTDEEPLQAFERFGKKLEEIEQKIVNMNNDLILKNRVGPANIPYTLLCPSSELGLTGRGIPNSVSI